MSISSEESKVLIEVLKKRGIVCDFDNVMHLTPIFREVLARNLLVHPNLFETLILTLVDWFESDVTDEISKQAGLIGLIIRQGDPDFKRMIATGIIV